MDSRSIFTLVAIGLGLASCATIVNGTTQEIVVVTPPVEGAECELTNSEGTWFLTTPGKATVDKTRNDFKVTCRKEGFQEASATVVSKFVADTAGNIILAAVF